MPLLSLIIPCFNAEDYIAASLKSALFQFPQETEIIIVDDGSTDSSRDIVEQLILENPKADIKLIKQKNCGPGAARNVGIGVAKGKYFGFLDADDLFIDGAGIEILRALKEKCPEIVEFDFVRFKDEIDLRTLSYKPLYEYNGMRDTAEILKNVFARTVWYPSIRVFSRSTWGEIRFPEAVYYEDPATIYKVYLRAKKIFFLSQPFLGYRINPLSITAKHTTKHLNDLCSLYWSLEGNSELIDIFRVRLARTISHLTHELFLTKGEYEKISKDVRKIKLKSGDDKLLLFPDRFFYYFPRTYDVINSLRFKFGEISVLSVRK